jgi:nickel/cobalt transporter (NicO) family protein
VIEGSGGRQVLNNSNLNAAMTLVAAVLAAVICILCAGVDVANAQGAFGVGGAAHFAHPEGSGVFGWVLAKQAAYYRDFSGLIRAAKANGTAVYGLLGLSFTYGVFHAAGPGHGKAVISSYLIANGETWRRGIALSFASALLQALAAVAIVGIFAALLGGTAATMTQAARVIEIASYCLIIAVGLRLCWMKGRNFVSELHGFSAAKQRPVHYHSTHSDSTAACAHDHDHDHEHNHHDHHSAHEHEHSSGCECGHAHGPQPEILSGPGGWRRGLAAILAVGLRPCSGAILLLVFALAQGLFWLGVVSTFVMGLGTALTVAAIATFAVAAGSAARKLAGLRSGLGGVALRGLELGASLVVVLFGVLLLMGYIATERLFGA